MGNLSWETFSTSLGSNLSNIRTWQVPELELSVSPCGHRCFLHLYKETSLKTHWGGRSLYFLLTLFRHLLSSSAQPRFNSSEHSHLALRRKRFEITSRSSQWGIKLLEQNYFKGEPTWVTRSLDSRMRRRESGSRWGQSIEVETTVKFHLKLICQVRPMIIHLKATNNHLIKLRQASASSV